MANHLSSISVVMNEVVKLLSQLVKVCGDAKASSSVAQGSAARLKAEIDEALLNENSIMSYLVGSHILSWLVIISPF